MKRSSFLYLRKSKCRADRALTLVEVLVTVTILAFIVTAVGASFFSGLKLWDRVRNVDFAHTAFILDLGMIARDLRQSVDVPAIGFEGDAGSFSFPAVDKGDVVKVTYARDPASGILTRRVQSLASIMAGQSPERKMTKEALSADQVSFQYLNREGADGVWVDVWSKDKGIFSAVKLEGVFKGEPFSKIIIIPLA